MMVDLLERTPFPSQPPHVRVVPKVEPSHFGHVLRRWWSNSIEHPVSASAYAISMPDLMSEPRSTTLSDWF